MMNAKIVRHLSFLLLGGALAAAQTGAEQGSPAEGETVHVLVGKSQASPRIPRPGTNTYPGP